MMENIIIIPHIAHPNPASLSNLFASSSVIFFKFMPEGVKLYFHTFHIPYHLQIPKLYDL